MQPQRNARIFEFMAERPAIVREVTDRVVSQMRRQANLSEDKALEYVLNEAAFLEMQRLARGSSKLDLRSYGFWHDLARQVGKASQTEKTRVLRELTLEYTEDVAGKFTPKVYWFATRVLPVGLSTLFNAQSFETLVKNFRQLSDRIVIDGHVSHARKLSQLGTVIVVPTHSSNLDSIVIGWTLEQAGLPPVTYGAGKNLFTNKLISFFMHNLGAYRVDRRIQNSIYKEVLKTYSQVLLEKGYHQLFFPGGTRSRSNEVESHLKLGLLGTSLAAYTRNLMAGRDDRVFIVPLTINYHLVLEAETLIGDSLRTDGGARYIIEDDEFSDLTKIALFSMKTMGMDASLHMRFGEALDPFGNFVDEEGRSLDPHGRPFEPSSYLWSNGEVRPDGARDREYTRLCGEAVAASFRRNTVVMTTQFLSWVMQRYLEDLYPGLDLYRLLRVSRSELIPFDALYDRAEQLRNRLLAMRDDNRIQLSQEVESLPIAELVERAARILTMYHTTPVVEMRSNGLEVCNPNLLYYYSNRLSGFGLERSDESERPSDAAAVDAPAETLEATA